MEAKHTKGEWISSGYRVDVDVADGLSGICEMSDWMEECEMKANAKLIAAAPELLEACIIAKIDTEMLLDGSADFTNENLLATIENLEKAIKKATE